MDPQGRGVWGTTEEWQVRSSAGEDNGTGTEFWMCPGVTRCCVGMFLLLKQVSLGFIQEEAREQIQKFPLCLSSPLAQVRVPSAVGSWSTSSRWKDFSVTNLF